MALNGYDQAEQAAEVADYRDRDYRDAPALSDYSHWGEDAAYIMASENPAYDDAPDEGDYYDD